MGTRISTPALAAQPIHTNEIANCNETVRKTNSGRSVRGMPSVLQRLVNKLKTFRCFNLPTSPRTVSKVDPTIDTKSKALEQEQNNRTSDRMIAEIVGEVGPTIDTKSKALEQEQNNRTSDRMIAELVGEENKALLKEICEAPEQKLLAKHVYSDPRYTKAKREFEMAEDWRRTREQLNTRICDLVNEITKLKSSGDYEANKVSIEARMSDLRQQFEALDVEDKGTDDLEQYRQLERDNNCYLQGAVLDILHDKLAQYEEMLKVRGMPADQHNYEYFALLNLVNKAREKYLDMAYPHDARAIAEKIDGISVKSNLETELQAAVAKFNQTRTMSKIGFGKASDSQSTIGQIGELTSEIGTSEDDDDDDEYEFFDALEYLEDGDEFFDAMEYQPNDYKQ